MDDRSRVIDAAPALARAHPSSLEHARVAALYHRGARVLGPGVAAAMLVTAAFWSLLSHAGLLVWLAAQFLVAGARLALDHAYRRRAHARGAAPARWERYYAFGAFAAGALWGALAAPLDAAWPAVFRDFLVMVLAGVSAGGAAAAAPSAIAATCVVLGVIAPLAIAMFSALHGPSVTVGTMVIVYAGVLLALAAQSRRDLADALRLRFHNDDLTESLASERTRLERSAIEDPLTGLSNRVALERHLETAFARSRREHRLLAVGLLDLDDFHHVNQTFGVAAGDRVLETLAQRLHATCRPNGLAARVGGDEFAVTFEDIEDPGGLDRELERLHEALSAPIDVDGGQHVELRASLGLALYPLHEASGPGAVLRLADQALYRTKSNKAGRERWWAIAGASDRTVGLTIGGPEAGGGPRFLYGESAARLLRPLEALLGHAIEDFLADFYHGVDTDSRTHGLLEVLSPTERASLEQRHAAYLKLLTRADLDADEHRRAARKVGRAHALYGIDRAWILDGYSLWLEAFSRHCAREAVRLRLALPVLQQRISLDLRLQNDVFEEVMRLREQARTRVSTLAWRARRWPDLIEGLVGILVELEDVVAAAVARADEGRKLRYEAAAGTPILRLIEQIEAGKVPAASLDANSAHGQVPGSRAWRSRDIERTINVATDPVFAPWRTAMLALGIRSLVAVPLFHGDEVHAVLVLYLATPGGFAQAREQRLLEDVQRSVSSSLVHLHDGPETGVAERGRVRPVPERALYRQLLGAPEGLRMHYQPVIDLGSGALAKVEALARLQHEERILSPAAFLPTFGDEDLLVLYRRGLTQSLGAVLRWRQAGLATELSVNLPPQGLSDPRYLQATHEALAANPGASARSLTLELLETEELTRDTGELKSRIAPYLELGVKFAEDDLGTGYGSLARMRELAFHTVKIDQALVRGAASEPENVLGFIAQLSTLIKHLGAEVVVEGLASWGLVEAAAILGADLGQGFALARPMTADALPEWARCHLPLAPDPQRPRTALGAMAALLRWEQRLAAIGTPASMRPGADPHFGGALEHFLLEHAREGAPAWQATREAAERGGLAADTFRAARARLLEELRARMEE